MIIKTEIDRQQNNVPYLTYALISMFIIVYLAELAAYIALGDQALKIIENIAFTFKPSGLITWFSAMFLHDIDPTHVLGNVVFLLIFGPPVEQILGRTRFMALYLLSGLVGFMVFGMTQAAAGSANAVIGASGAISGIMGIALVRFPRNSLVTTVKLPRLEPRSFYANVKNAMLIYLGLQLVFAVVSINGTGGKVAYMGHLGGFLVGFVAVRFLGLEKEAHHEEVYLDANSLSRAGDFEAAISRYEDLIKQHPETPKYRFLSSKVWLQIGDKEKAQARYKEAIEGFIKKRDSKGASEAYDELDRFFSEAVLDAGILYKVGMACESSHRYEAALKAFKKVKESPDDSLKELASLKQGEILKKMGSLEKARKSLEEFTSTFPQSNYRHLAERSLKELSGDK